MSTAPRRPTPRPAATAPAAPLFNRRQRWILAVLATGLGISSLALLLRPDSAPDTATALPAGVTATETGTAPTLTDELLPLDEPLLDVAETGPFLHTIAPGETLSELFSRHELDRATMQAVLAADEELLALDILRPGQMLVFDIDEQGSLQRLTLRLRPGHVVHYQRVDGDHFEFEDVRSPSEWRDYVFTGDIQGSFFLSARRAGLSDAEIARAQRILGEKIDFRRDLRAGDRFEMVVGQEVTDEGPTGHTRIEALRLQLGRRTVAAYLHDDSNYYDEDGDSLGRAFLRHPMQSQHRISSPFNLGRLHPVTGRVAPHHGVDFAMPVGTPVLTTGDGVVTRVGNHPFAGRYVEIQHPGQFKTRYLHLSRVLVRQGESVSRGARIALSGNTGRTTGPHLHFELHINQRPVNPMTAHIPTAHSVPAAQLAEFRQRVENLVASMDYAEQFLALHEVDTSGNDS